MMVYIYFAFKIITVFWNIAIAALCFNGILTVFFMTEENPQIISAKIIIPLMWTILLLIKWITSKYANACKHVFPCFILIFGSTCTYENTFFNHFKIFEIWLMYYFFCSLIVIWNWFDWKRIVLAFWIVKVNYVVVMTWTYGMLSNQFYIGILYASITYPIISIIVTKKIYQKLH